ncbi:MAG: PQQ-binding-like beta-propeller repeat protein, partial [Polyangiaceae bacterium]
MSLKRILPLCLLALCTLAPSARATNPAYAKRTRVGVPPGITNMARADVSRSGLTQTALPGALVVKRELRVTGGITSGMLSDADGRLIVATLDPELVQLSPEGKQQWSVSTGKSAAVVQPVLLSDGTRVLLNADNQLFGFGSSGTRRFSIQLAPGHSPSTDLLPMPDGSVVVAHSTRLLRVSAEGRVLDTARTHSKVVGLLAKGRDVLALT